MSLDVYGYAARCMRPDGVPDWPAEGRRLERAFNALAVQELLFPIPDSHFASQGFWQKRVGRYAFQAAVRAGVFEKRRLGPKKRLRYALMPSWREWLPGYLARAQKRYEDAVSHGIARQFLGAR